MGCFPCFISSKNRKLNKYVIPTISSPSSVDQGNDKSCESVLIRIPTRESTNFCSIQAPIRESREDQLVNDSDSKRVTIDSDVKTKLDISTEEVEIILVENKEDKGKNVNSESGKLRFLVQLENEKERENEKNKVFEKLGVLVQIKNDMEIERENESNEEYEGFRVHVEIESKSGSKKELKTEEQNNKIQSQSQTVSDSSVSSYISYPPMHRYHNCEINEDEDEDEEEEDQVIIQEESSESLFSIDPTKQSKSHPIEIDDKEVNSPLKINSSLELIDHNQKIDSLLNPIENLAQWKTLKARPTSNHHQEKENVFLEQEEIPNFKGKLKTDTAVTTSLSSWLVDPEKSTVSKEESQYSTGNSYSVSDGATSWKSFEDRPILGAWTINEVRQISARSSARKSPRHHPDETPIIGTVGSYWSHTGQATDSSKSYTSSPINMSAKSRRNAQNKASSCHSTPKRRLERTFDKSYI